MLTKRLRQSGVVVSCLLASVLFIALAFLGWQRFAPAATVSGWTYRVVLEDIPTSAPWPATRTACST
ncbi:hypothetical protein P4056_25940 [Pseudomonas aeruginosa]|nr:hypothetical protein [Pseudomonas aeruginosa]